MVMDGSARRTRWWTRVSLALALGGWLNAVMAEVFHAGPDDYLLQLRRLGPGDRLQLAPGHYRHGLSIHRVHGAPGRPIVIAGPTGDDPAVFVARPDRNVVSIADASYVTVRDLEIDGRGAFVDGVKAEGYATSAHHITLENLYIHDLVDNQQSVGISTKCPAWDWVIRSNRIERVGTGMYFGDSDGSDPFVGGLIEHNHVVDTIGYSLQVKHQRPRPAVAGIPAEPRRTIIRRNLFVKQRGASTGPMARPNVLVGHWPLQGPGKDDEYLVYGNVFFQNPSEALFQGEGNIALYDNLFFDEHANRFPAVAIQPHNDIPRRVRIFFNTVVKPEMGIRVLRDTERAVEGQDLIGNAVFAAAPLQGGWQSDNVTAPYAKAAAFLRRPYAPLSDLDLAPLPGRLRGPTIDLGPFDDLPDHDRDFAGRLRTGDYRGAHAASDLDP